MSNTFDKENFSADNCPEDGSYAEIFSSRLTSLKPYKAFDKSRIVKGDLPDFDKFCAVTIVKIDRFEIFLPSSKVRHISGYRIGDHDAIMREFNQKPDDLGFYYGFCGLIENKERWLLLVGLNKTSEVTEDFIQSLEHYQIHTLVDIMSSIEKKPYYIDPKKTYRINIQQISENALQQRLVIDSIDDRTTTKAQGWLARKLGIPTEKYYSDD